LPSFGRQSLLWARRIFPDSREPSRPIPSTTTLEKSLVRERSTPAQNAHERSRPVMGIRLSRNAASISSSVSASPPPLLHLFSHSRRYTTEGRLACGSLDDDHYLGPYGSPESREQYDKLVAEWFANQNLKQCVLTLDDVALLYLAHASEYYRTPDGTPTSEVGCVRLALRPLIKSHGTTGVRDLGPLD